MTNEEALIAITLADGTITIRRFFTRSQGSNLPAGAEWEDQAKGIWTREPISNNINHEVRRAQSVGSPMVSWRIVTQADVAMGWDAQDRGLYRNALVDTGAKVEYDLSTAKECHRRIIREQRSAALIDLDGEYMRALGQDKKAEQATIEAQRQVWRDAPADPRIEAAKTIEELKLIGVI